MFCELALHSTEHIYAFRNGQLRLQVYAYFGISLAEQFDVLLPEHTSYTASVLQKMLTASVILTLS